MTVSRGTRASPLCPGATHIKKKAEQAQHGGLVHNHEHLEPVGKAAAAAAKQRDDRLGHHGKELHELQAGQLLFPPRFNAKRGQQVV
jgi:hypothetical protein